MVSPPTWALARADYPGGMTAQAVADKHGTGLHKLRQTIARKGWKAGPGGPPQPRRMVRGSFEACEEDK